MQAAVAAGVMGMDNFPANSGAGGRNPRCQRPACPHHPAGADAHPALSDRQRRMQSQAAGAQQINETLVQLGNAAGRPPSRCASPPRIEQLNEAARGLQNSVARFKLKT